MSEKFNAADSLKGYFYQIGYALLQVLEASDGDEVVIEGLDDIQIDKVDGGTILIQTKNHGHQGRLSDYSTELWSTLRVWSNAFATGEISLDNTRMMLITRNKADANSAVGLLRPSIVTSRNEELALEKLMIIANTSANQANNKAYHDFKTLLSNEQRLELLRRVDVLDGSMSINDLDNKIRKALRPGTTSENLDEFFTAVKGWWLTRITTSLANKDRVKATYADIDGFLDQLRNQYGRRSLPTYVITGIPKSESHLKKSERVFVWQLHLIELIDDRIVDAISDYFKAFKHRTNWVMNLHLTDEIAAYDDRLVSEWKAHFNKLKQDIQKCENDAQRLAKAQEMYDRFVLQMFIPIRPDFPETSVMRGSYHVLANKLRVGWHPEYENLIKTKLTEVKQTK